MKNQLVLITEDPAPRSGRPGSRSDASDPRAAAGRSHARRGGDKPEVRARRGAAAARDALRVAVQRSTAREQARRQAREKALLAAVTQPHLPHVSTRPGRSAA